MPNKSWPWLGLLVILVLGLSAVSCQPVSDNPEASNEISAPQGITIAATQTPVPSPTPQPISLYLSTELPSDFKQQLHVPVDWVLGDDSQQAAMKIGIGLGTPLSTWVYALVAPFPTVTDGVRSQDLQQFWSKGTSANFPAATLLVDADTQAVFEKLWGPASKSVKSVTAKDIVDQAWEQSSTWAIIPFDQIEPRWKVMEVDGSSPIRKEFDPAGYPLVVTFTLNGDAAQVENALAAFGPSSAEPLAPAGNRDANKLTTVVLTGVTALVRGTAGMMEAKGMTYPDQDIRDWLRSADFTHINNEVPFSPKCPPPFPREDNLVFCSKPAYIELLEDVGTDIIELSGDHFQDWGADAMLYTIDLYEKEGWKYYGGGRNLEDAQKPLLIEHNGNKLAFLGCNAKPPGYAGASATQPGAVHCDWEEMQAQVKSLRAQGYLPIVTFQHLEYYSYDINPNLRPDFELMAQSGAVIVSGSQAHQPQGMEFLNNAFLHYGLGNLFFDQYFEGFPTRQAFIDRHVFYDGQYINTELLTIMFIDLARPRPMTADERQQLLETVFANSDWSYALTDKK